MNNSNREFFDSIASQWDTMIDANDLKINHILDVAQMREGDSILDVGTGTGVLLPYIVHRIGPEGKIVAVDVSAGMLAQAKKKFGSLANLDFICTDVESDLIDGQYDHIMMYCMYPHLDAPEDTVEWLTKVNLKPGGNLIIAFPESKTSINAIHHHNDGSVHTAHLQDGNLVKARFALKGLDVDYVEDTDDFYVLRITK